LLEKLYNMGIITAQKQFSQVSKITVSAFCRRRLPIVMCRLKMAETVKEAVTFVEQGHIRVGPETVSDPAYLVTRNMEDFVTWVDTSKIKRKIMKYNDKVSNWIMAVWGWLVFYPLYHKPNCLFSPLASPLKPLSWTISTFCKTTFHPLYTITPVFILINRVQKALAFYALYGGF
jgi:ribosomal protein S4